MIIKTIDSTPTNDYFVINKHNGNISSHVVSSKIEIISPLFSKYFEEFVLASNQGVTLENNFNLTINGLSHKIKRIQYVTDKGNYETLDEIYYDINTYERFSEEEILNSFGIEPELFKKTSAKKLTKKVNRIKTKSINQLAKASYKR